MKIKKMRVLSDIVFYPLGRIYLWNRYRTKETIKKVLIEKYEKSNVVAGTLICLKTFGVVFIILVLLMILAVIYSVIKQGVS
jgi:hypothetical protein